MYVRVDGRDGDLSHLSLLTQCHNLAVLVQAALALKGTLLEHERGGQSGGDKSQKEE